MEKYTNEAQKIITACENLAFRFSHRLIGSEHLLLAFLKTNNVLSKELEHYSITYEKLYNKIKNLYPHQDNEPVYMEYTLELRTVLENARVISHQYHEEELSINSLAASILISDNSLAYELLKKNNVDIRFINQNIQSKMSKHSELSTITDLHALAEINKDPLIGREQELRQLINALSRRNKPNAILVGEPGVGKTAIVEELANLLKENKIDSLKGKEIYELDLASTVGGTKYRGEFEEKIKKIFKKVIDDGDCILFIDEIHNIIKAGGAEGAIDASNIIKPYLSRGEIQIIGATTEDEFQNIFEKDKALKRRFQIIKVSPSTTNQTKNILYKSKNIYERFYNNKISDEVIDYIVEQAEDLLPNAYFPDKAIDLLDNTCVTFKGDIGKKQVDDTLKMFYHVQDKNSDKFSDLFAELKNKVIGQDAAINKIKENVLLMNENKRINNETLLNLLFIGPSGVGKSLCAQIIGEKYFGEENIVYLNMSSYKDFDGLNKLLGANYTNGINSKLIRELKAHPRSLLIIDEIEKANNEIIDFFSQIMDKGYFDTLKGERISCKNVMIIMITNHGFDKNYSFSKITKNIDEKLIINHLKDRFRYEFLSQFDDLICFNYLTKENLKIIAKKYLEKVNVNIDQEKIEDIFSFQEGEYLKFGAKMIQKDCKKILVKELMNKQY